MMTDRKFPVGFSFLKKNNGITVTNLFFFY